MELQLYGDMESIAALFDAAGFPQQQGAHDPAIHVGCFADHQNRLLLSYAAIPYQGVSLVTLSRVPDFAVPSVELLDANPNLEEIVFMQSSDISPVSRRQMRLKSRETIQELHGDDRAEIDRFSVVGSEEYAITARLHNGTERTLRVELAKMRPVTKAVLEMRKRFTL